MTRQSKKRAVAQKNMPLASVTTQLGTEESSTSNAKPTSKLELGIVLESMWTRPETTQSYP